MMDADDPILGMGDGSMPPLKESTDSPAPTPREVLAKWMNVERFATFIAATHPMIGQMEREYLAALAASGRGMTADTLTAQLAASEAAREKLTADIAAVRAAVAVRTAREHRAGCPALQAWDVPGACVCDNPKISRCGVCGHRVARPAPDAGGV